VRLGSADRGRLAVAVASVALVVVSAAGCGASKRDAAIALPSPTTAPCLSVQGCQQAISRRSGQPVLMPAASELRFVSGMTTDPGTNLSGLYGQVTFKDTSTGWTVNYLVWSAQDLGYGSPSKCGALVPFTSPKGRKGCYEDRAVRWNQLYTKFPQGGIVYGMNAEDPRGPSPSTAAADQRWAIALVDTYQ